MIATILQFTGTLVISLFSFYGIKITNNQTVNIEGKSSTRVEFSPIWLKYLKIGIILFLLGILLSGFASIINAV